MKSLFLVHCGFYDSELCDGLYESHVNFFVVGESFEEARLHVKELPEFKAKRMHVDGLQEIVAVEGFRVELQPDAETKGQTLILSHRHRDLATKAKSPELS